MIRWMANNWKTRTGCSLAVLHAFTLTVLIFSKPLLPPSEPCAPEADCVGLANPASIAFVAGRVFHWSYETPLLQCLMLADLPSQVVGVVVMLPLWVLLKSVSVSEQRLSYLNALNWIFFGSLQWWLIAAIVKATWKRNRAWQQP